MGFINKIRRALRLYNTIKGLGYKERTSLLRMLYWKTHYEGIPKEESNKMVKDGWLIKKEKGKTWSDKANEITRLIHQ